MLCKIVKINQRIECQVTRHLSIPPSFPPTIVNTTATHLNKARGVLTTQELMYIVVSNRTIVLKVFYTFIQGRHNNYDGRCNITHS